ncbi:hypothetical protein [Streptomyces sp. NPDC002559]
MPAFDATAYPAMAALGPLMAAFGSLAEFDQMLDTVLAGIKDRAALMRVSEVDLGEGLVLLQRQSSRRACAGRISDLSASVDADQDGGVSHIHGHTNEHTYCG